MRKSKRRVSLFETSCRCQQRADACGGINGPRCGDHARWEVGCGLFQRRIIFISIFTSHKRERKGARGPLGRGRCTHMHPHRHFPCRKRISRLLLQNAGGLGLAPIFNFTFRAGPGRLDQSVTSATRSPFMHLHDDDFTLHKRTGTTHFATNEIDHPSPSLSDPFHQFIYTDSPDRSNE